MSYWEQVKMRADKAREFGLYNIPTRGEKKAEFIGMAPQSAWCKFLVFNQYGERKVIMVASDTEIEESK